MPLLALDVGNTRLKWAMFIGGAMRDHGALILEEHVTTTRILGNDDGRMDNRRRCQPWRMRNVYAFAGKMFANAFGVCVRSQAACIGATSVEPSRGYQGRAGESAAAPRSRDRPHLRVGMRKRIYVNQIIDCDAAQAENIKFR